MVEIHREPIKEIIPDDLVVQYNSKTLESGLDYTIEYLNNIKPNLEKLYQQINGIVVSDTGKVKKKKQQKKRRISDYDW